jgi:hypothetical protein
MRVSKACLSLSSPRRRTRGAARPMPRCQRFSSAPRGAALRHACVPAARDLLTPEESPPLAGRTCKTRLLIATETARGRACRACQRLKDREPGSLSRREDPGLAADAARRWSNRGDVHRGKPPPRSSDDHTTRDARRIPAAAQRAIKTVARFRKYRTNPKDRTRACEIG